MPERKHIILLLHVLLLVAALTLATISPVHAAPYPLHCSLSTTVGRGDWQESMPGDQRNTVLIAGQTRCAWRFASAWTATVDLGGGASRLWATHEGESLGIWRQHSQARLAVRWDAAWLGLALGVLAKPQWAPLTAVRDKLLPVATLRVGPEWLFFHAGVFDGGLDGGVLHSMTAGVGTRFDLADDPWHIEVLGVGLDTPSWADAVSLSVQATGPLLGFHVEALKILRWTPEDGGSWPDYTKGGWAFGLGILWPGTAKETR